jgi:hypothetical protein
MEDSIYHGGCIAGQFRRPPVRDIYPATYAEIDNLGIIAGNENLRDTLAFLSRFQGILDEGLPV